MRSCVISALSRCRDLHMNNLRSWLVLIRPRVLDAITVSQVPRFARNTRECMWTECMSIEYLTIARFETRKSKSRRLKKLSTLSRSSIQLGIACNSTVPSRSIFRRRMRTRWGWAACTWATWGTRTRRAPPSRIYPSCSPVFYPATRNKMLR